MAGSGRAQELPPQDPAFPLSPDQDPQLSPTEELLERCAGKIVVDIRIGRVGNDGNGFFPLEGAMADSIKSNIRTKKDQPLDGVKLQQDLKQLVTERSFATTLWVDFVDEGVVLYFVIVKADRTFDELRFKGVDEFDEATLQSVLDILPNQRVSWLQAQSMRNILLARYRREGFAYCSIELRPDQQVAAGSPLDARREFRSLTMHVDEGPKVKIRDVEFRGNVSFPGNEPLPFMNPQEVLNSTDTGIKSTSGVFSAGPYSTEVIEEDEDRLRLFYRSRGFRDAQVFLASAVPSEDHTEMDLTFRIIEGERYRVAAVELERLDERGEPIPEEDALYPADQVMEGFLVEPGDFYDAESVAADLRKIERFYGERGHPVGSRLPQALRILEPDELVDPDRHEIVLIYQILEGTPKRLRDVVVRGNTYTEDRVIRRKIFQGPGERINMPEIQRSSRALQATGYFRDSVTQQGPRITLIPALGGADDEVDLDVQVKEGDTGQFRWGVGISTGAGAQASIIIDKYNFDISNLPSPSPAAWLPEILENKAFHGAGQSLRLLLAPGTQISQFSISFTDPDIFRQHQDTIGLRVTGARELRRFDTFLTDRLRAGVTFTRNFTNEFSLGWTLRQETVDVEDPDINAPQIVFDAEGQTELRGSRITARFEDVDNRLVPSEGTQAQVYAELIGGFHGGGESFWKSGLSLDRYLWLREDAVGRRHVLHLGANFDVGSGFGKSERLFLTDRLFMGGGNLRGFDFRGAGPFQFGRATGGEARVLGTAEYFFPLVASRQTAAFSTNELIRGVVFADFGLLGSEIDTADFGQPRLSMGFGVRINVPVLNIPIALDLGWPLLYERTDDRRQLFFSLTR